MAKLNGKKVLGLGCLFMAVAGTAVVGSCSYAAYRGFGLSDKVYSDGDRVGIVTKISHKGMLYKSWEGEMAMDNFVAKPTENGSVMSNTFNFSVLDPEIVKKIQDAQKSGERVQLTYKQTYTADLTERESTYVIIAVNPADTPKAKPAAAAPK